MKLPPAVTLATLADAAGAENSGVDERFVADALRKLAAALGTLKLAELGYDV